MVNNSGGAAMNAGADFQQRVAAYFLLQMALQRDCATTLESTNGDKILQKVAFETDDDVDDIVLTHEDSKTYLQAKRKLSLSDRDNSDFFKTIDQFVRQDRISQNSKDSYVLVTSHDTSEPIKKHLKKVVNSVRLSSNSIEENPITKSELAAYGKLKRCIDKSFIKNGFGKPTKIELEKLIKKIHIVFLDIEKNGISEKSFLESLLNKFTIEPSVIWNLVIAQALDLAKNKQSVDVDGIDNLLSKFKLDEPEQTAEELEMFFKVKFDLDNDIICSGRELVLMESPYPEHNYQLVEFKRFDEEGLFRINFLESSIVMGSGDEFELLGRFSTFKGAKRYIEESCEKFDNLLFIPINSDNSSEYDNTPIAKAYSEKVRNHILANNDATRCIHCQNGLSYPAILVEIQENDLPFDAGMIHPECLRVSDRVLGKSEKKGVVEHPEFHNFDFNKWISLLDKSQGLWAGLKTYPVNQPIKTIVWNSNSKGDLNGGCCIKIKLKDGSTQYVLERGKVQRYSRLAAQDVCSSLEQWLLDSKAQNNPLCYSSDGGLQGKKKDIQSNYNNPIDLIECKSFTVVTFTRGIGTKYDKLNNYYAPLIVFADMVSGEYITAENTVFLITDPSELKVYLDNWVEIELAPETYRLCIIENDAEFDKFMHWTKKNAIGVLVDPFFDDEKNLLKGAVIEDLAELEKQNKHIEEVERFCLLFTKSNEDGTFSQIYRDFVNDVTLLLHDKCTCDGCKCIGCQMYDVRIAHYGKDNVDIRQSNENTIVLNLSDSESEWTQEFVENHSVDWNDWESLVT